jgi:hypothetical protein
MTQLHPGLLVLPIVYVVAAFDRLVFAQVDGRPDRTAFDSHPFDPKLLSVASRRPHAATERPMNWSRFTKVHDSDAAGTFNLLNLSLTSTLPTTPIPS